MKTIRLTKVAHVVHFWDFISKSLQSVSSKSREPYDEEYVRKTLFNLVVLETTSWLAVVVDEYGEPQAFGCAQDCTPPFSNKRYFVVRWFYHTPLQFRATLTLMASFEQWAKDNGVSVYAVTTAKADGRLIRCFMSERFGFKRSFVTLEKDLNL